MENFGYVPVDHACAILKFFDVQVSALEADTHDGCGVSGESEVKS